MESLIESPEYLNLVSDESGNITGDELPGLPHDDDEKKRELCKNCRETMLNAEELKNHLKECKGVKKNVEK